MKFTRNLISLSIAALFATSIVSPASLAEDSVKEQGLETLPIEETYITGTRKKGRTAMDSPVPIDSFDTEALARQGNGDMTEALKNLVPSFNATPLTGDGAAFVRSTSMRGLPPDETLVLVNSKRRHRSALIAHFGAAMNAGSQAVDVGPIPSIALKSVEVLRDGAAAQYGSDAIAGVINFLLKDDDEGGEVRVKLGRWFEGENDIQVAANAGFGLGENGFLNVSAEYSDDDELSRGFQHSDAIGVPGARNPAMNWGRPATSGLRTFWNGGIDLSEDVQLYFFGNYAHVEGDYSFFYRAPGMQGALTPIPIDPADPSQGNFCLCDQYPAGFTPYLEGKSLDLSQNLGIKGEFSGGTLYDVSIGYGHNRISYLLTDTVNLSWGLDAHTNGLRDMDIGDLKQEELNFNADFATEISPNLNLAYGVEWREESYTMYEGEELAWKPGRWALVGGLIDPVTGENYATPGNAANGMAGTSPDEAGTWSRRNWAVYTDAEWDLSDRFLLQGALRHEDFSDFGATSNAKLAARYSVSDALTLRGAVSTGFRAPTPGQSNYEGVTTTFDGVTGQQTLQGTLRPTNPLSVANGGKALDAESSLNFGTGITWTVSDAISLTADVYRIEVEDRIVKTSFLPVSDPNFSLLSFYTNGLDTETTGIDLVATWDLEWHGGDNTSINLAYNRNETEVTDVHLVNGIAPVQQSYIDNIENNLPKTKANLTVAHYMEKFSAMVRATYYSETQDERGAPPEWMGDEVIVDLEMAYDIKEAWAIALGASNLFDTYPDEVQSRMSQGMPYARRTPIGYLGGMYYLRTTYRF